jgi:hypothetical protein
LSRSSFDNVTKPPKPLIFLAAAHERIARLTSKTRERDNAHETTAKSDKRGHRTT